MKDMIVDRDITYNRLDKELAVFKENVTAKFDKINNELTWITRITLFQLGCLILLLGGDAGLAVLRTLKIIP